MFLSWNNSDFVIDNMTSFIYETGSSKSDWQITTSYYYDHICMVILFTHTFKNSF